MTRRPILLFGSGGQLGRAIRKRFADLDLVALGREDVDVEDVPALRRVVRQHEPAVIINAAAYTAVDRAESDRERCFAVNAHAPMVLAEEAERSGCVLVHYSSDYVFDGTATRPYVESDEPHPINVYGESKAAADRGIPSACSRHIILRSSWVFGAHGSNFVTTMLRLAREREELRVVDDQVGSPTSARFLAEMTSRFVDLHLRSPSTAPVGLFHATLSGSTTWYEFARAILASDPDAARHSVTRIIPISTAEFRSQARRPAYSVLDSGKLHRALQTTPADWISELAAVLGEINGASAT